MIRRLILALLPVAAVAILLSGCRHQKSVTGPAYTDASGLSLQQRAAFVASCNQPWEELNVPVKIAFKSPQKLSVSGRVYMRRDSDIYVTLRVLGLEVANIYIDNDSVFAADRIHKYYVAEAVSDIFAVADLTIGDIQDAMLGRCFINGKGAFSDAMLGDVKLWLSDRHSWVMASRSAIAGDTEYQFQFSDSDNTLTALIFNVAGKHYGCNYSDPADTRAGRFMQCLSIKTNVGKTAIDATVNYDFGKAKWSVPNSARRHHYDNYHRLTRSNLSKAFAL